MLWEPKFSTAGALANLPGGLALLKKWNGCWPPSLQRVSASLRTEKLRLAFRDQRLRAI